MLNGMENRGRGLSARLTELREAALGTAYMFRMSGEEVAQMIGQINEAGLQINEWKDYTGAAANIKPSWQARCSASLFRKSVGLPPLCFTKWARGLNEWMKASE